MTLNLPKLPYNIPLVEQSLVPTKSFQQWWQSVADNVQTSVNGLADAVADIQTLQDDMADRITEISNIQTDLADQLTQILAVLRNDSISSSWTSPGGILTAADAGTDVTITIANHSRKYGDSTTVAVTGGTVTGLAYTTTYQLYYDDPDRVGGAVTYHATTNPNDALHNSSVGRHYCGEILTPAAGAGSTNGGVSPPSSGGQIDFTSTP